MYYLHIIWHVLLMETISSQRDVREDWLPLVAWNKDSVCDLEQMCSSTTYKQSSLQDASNDWVHCLYIFPSKIHATFLSQGQSYSKNCMLLYFSEIVSPVNFSVCYIQPMTDACTYVLRPCAGCKHLSQWVCWQWITQVNLTFFFSVN